jgi:hypothetical protein
MGISIIININEHRAEIPCEVKTKERQIAGYQIKKLSIEMFKIKANTIIRRLFR